MFRLSGEKFQRFDEALVKLIDLLELPGVGRYISGALWVARLPYRAIRGAVGRMLKRPEGVPPVVPDAAMVSGPFLPCLGSIWPPGPFLSTAMDSSVVWINFCAVPFAGEATVSDRVSGNAVGTRASGRVMGLDS